MTYDDISDADLVEKFGDACFRNGECSGYGISAGVSWENMEEWKAALMLRLKELRELAATGPVKVPPVEKVAWRPAQGLGT